MCILWRFCRIFYEAGNLTLQIDPGIFTWRLLQIALQNGMELKVKRRFWALADAAQAANTVAMDDTRFDRLAAATRNYGVTCHRQVRRSCSSVEMALTPTPGEARPLPLHQLHPINLHPVVHLEHVGDGLSCVHQLTVPGPGVLGGEKILQGVRIGWSGIAPSSIWTT